MSDFSRLMELAMVADAKKAQEAMGGSTQSLAEQLAAAHTTGTETAAAHPTEHRDAPAPADARRETTEIRRK